MYVFVHHMEARKRQVVCIIWWSIQRRMNHFKIENNETTTHIKVEKTLIVIIAIIIGIQIAYACA